MSTLKVFTSLLISNRSDSTNHWTLTLISPSWQSIFQDSPGSSLTMLWCGGTAGERTALTSACRHCQHSTEPGLATGDGDQWRAHPPSPSSHRGQAATENTAHTSLTVIQLIIKQSVSLKIACMKNRSECAVYCTVHTEHTNRLRYLTKSKEVLIFLEDITKTILLISIKSDQ